MQRSDLASAGLVLVTIGIVALLLTLSLPRPPQAVVRVEPLESPANLSVRSTDNSKSSQRSR